MSVLSERFHLGRRLGAGGFGTVHEAWDTQRRARVALKRLDRVEGHALHRFVREFRALSGLSHPNLVGLHELFGVRPERSWRPGGSPPPGPSRGSSVPGSRWGGGEGRGPARGGRGGGGRGRRSRQPSPPRSEGEVRWSRDGAVYVYKERFGDLEALVALCPEKLRGRTALDVLGLDAAAAAERWPEALIFNESRVIDEPP